jgi:hypothetical protein
MTGAHRSTTQDPLHNGLKSTTWLVTLGALVLLPLALLGLVAFLIYSAVANSSDAQPLATGLISAAWLWLSADFARTLARTRRPRSPAQVAHLISEAWILLCITSVLFNDIGDLLGWDHGPFRVATIGVAVAILVGFTASFFGGKRRLVALLEKRAAARQER